jgi:hypothetical protein
MKISDNTLHDAALIIKDQSDAENPAVSWAAIIAGAITAASVTLILLLLGSGLGFAAVSPWANSGISAATFTITAAIWLIITQWIASGLSGYLTGRLRTSWLSVDRDEIFFRDTAHGFLAWALATFITAGFLASAIAAIIAGGATAVTTGVAVGASHAVLKNTGDKSASITDYMVDSLFRRSPINTSDRTSPSMDVPPNITVLPDTSETPREFEIPTPPASARPSFPTISTAESYNIVCDETIAILINGVRDGTVPDADRAYLAQLIASRAEVSMEEATKRVDDTIAQIEADEIKLRQAADTARRTASTISVYSFLSLLIGAFIASAAAALGGQHRDEY